jgi:transcriptional regulator with XRE-family HTH domain
MPTPIERFRKALAFIKTQHAIDSDKEAAEALKITPSYLSQILLKKKPLTPAIISRLEQRFNVRLNDPFTYTDLKSIGMTEGFDDENFATLLRQVRAVLDDRSQIIEAQHKLLEALKKERNDLLLLFHNTDDVNAVLKKYKPNNKKR